MPRKAKEKEVNENILNEKEEPKSSAVKVTKKSSSKVAKKDTSTSTKKVKKTVNKDDVKKEVTNTSKSKKSNDTKAKKDTKASEAKKTTKTSTSKKTAKTSDTKKPTKTSSAKKTTKKSTSSEEKPKKVTKSTVKKSTKKIINDENSEVSPISLEYYDLPYKYNKTVVKLLAQNPNTLFVYWEISDDDRKHFIDKYGDNFFYITKPVLVIHNLTDKYSYEIDINDFANSWYIHVNDSNSQYIVELGRRPIEHTEKITEDYLYITSSNLIEAPNDHVLFFKENDEIYFKNIHTNEYTKKVIKPFLKNIYGIYEKLNLSKEINHFDFKNPSSQNPTSNV